MTEKTALVTGASRGIGKAIAKSLGAAGFIVIGTATTKDGANNISEYLNSANIKGLGKVLNVTSQDSIDSLMHDLKQDGYVPTVLVNNAAVTKDNLLMRMKEEEWLNVVETNLNSVFRMTKACIRDMVKARFGRIISIGSVVGSTGNPGQVNYSSSKAGVLGFTKSLAQELGSRGITVNAVAPGFIDTDMTRVLSEDQQKSLLSMIPVNRLGNVEDIAEAVTFLASDNASYITGQTLHVNGGMYMP